MRNISKPEKVAEKINELLKNRIDRFKHLKRNTVPTLLDLEVVDAVLTWINNKLDNCNLTSLPKPCQYVYACDIIILKVNEDGLNLLYFNQTKQLAQIAQEGFNAIGNNKLSEFMEKANKIYLDNQSLFDKYCDGTKESYIKLYNETLFDELDYNLFEEGVPSFEDNLVEYIRKNEIYFGE
jgi:hypothetical protein